MSFPALTAGEPRAIVLVIGYEDAFEQLRALRPLEGAALLCVECRDWYADLSPWPAPACFRGEPAFSGGADAFLGALEQALCRARAELRAPAAPAVLAGSSLAGLFALYAMYKSSAFQMAASVSGSMWFDGFLDFARLNALKRRDARIYLSLGDREEFAKNARLACVGERTRALYAHLKSAGAQTQLDMNPGNHFAEPIPRMLRALKWLLGGEQRDSHRPDLSV